MSETDDYVPESTLGLDPVAFSLHFPHAVLLVEEPGSSSDTTEFRTLVGSRQAALAAAAKQAGRLIRVRKREGNPFAMMITIGRALNNDIHIPGKDISKFHAYLSRNGSDWQVTDAGSTNGTFVAGQQLPLRIAQPLELGVPIILGSTQVTLLEGEHLYQHLSRTVG